VNLRAKASGPIPHLALPFVIKKDINFGQQDKGAAAMQVSISSTFFARVFCTNFWR